jgi:hypothetical protein
MTAVQAPNPRSVHLKPTPVKRILLIVAGVFGVLFLMAVSAIVGGVLVLQYVTASVGSSTSARRPPATGLTTTLADGRVVPAYQALDGTLQPTSTRSTCVYSLQGLMQGGPWMQGGRLNFFMLPDNQQQWLRHLCSAEDVQAAEEGRLVP